MSDKATRAQIQIGPYSVEGFMLPDGSYVMSQTQAAELVGLTERNTRVFLRSKALKSLLGENYTPAISEIEADADQTPRDRESGIALTSSSSSTSPNKRVEISREITYTSLKRFHSIVTLHIG